MSCRLTLADSAGKAVTAGHLLVRHFFQAHRHPTDGANLVDALVIGLQGANLHLPIGGVEAQLAPHLEAALLQGAGKHGAGAIGGKDPVYIEARGGLFAESMMLGHIPNWRTMAVCRAAILAPVLALTLTMSGTMPLSSITRSSRLSSNSKSSSGETRIALVDADQEARHPHRLEQAQVIAGHRHPPLVGGNHQQHQIQTPEPRHHVADIALVAGHVDDADGVALTVVEVGKAEILGHADGLLVGAGGGDAGKGLDQQGLAVIHVAGKADNGAIGGHGIRAPRSHLLH